MAGQIPQHFIDDLLSKIDIVDVVDQRVTLKKSGSNYKACCPFHSEKTPSFNVSQTKQFYHCFGCNASGNAISFLMEYDNMHFVDAIETLADSAGMEVPRSEQATQERDAKKPLYQLMDSIAVYYQQQLKLSQEAIAYLKARGLSGETAKRFGIGFIPEGWDNLQQRFPEEQTGLLKTGMLIQSDAGKRPYQRFRNRIMFPIRDRRGRVIGFGGRVMDNQEPKYLNSPETPLFHKGSELYGLFEARKCAQDAGSALVVEGYMDVVALAEHGINNAVAALGTGANQQHSETLFKVVPAIVFCFDGDKAGRAAAWRALQATLPCLADGRDAHFLFLPEGEDPDSVVKAQGAAGFRDLLATRISIIDFLYQQLSANVDMTSVGGKAQLAEKAKPLLATIPQSIYKQLAMRRLESLIGLSLGSDSTAQPWPSERPASRLDQGGLTPMRRAVLLCLQHPPVVQTLAPEDIDVDSELRGADLLIKLISYCDNNPAITTALLIEKFRNTEYHGPVVKLASKSYWPDHTELDFDTAASDFAACMKQLRKRSQQKNVNKVDPSFDIGLVNMAKQTNLKP